ncbi:DUF3488 and DUF4129 domain-containing transglutaminase family protein [Marinibactrum halimedae]|uniref:Protein-glutamine gamma-glutamyltransferase n=1 Tax=Marinibactrum halimedae TaxID=1444977 RepID=A0AA37WLZ7_9GAMM|nr:DUF3488 and transglutaminase-like domain-containing protein [Marinibactrum halimedae]MCD9460767.1 DUF3488 and transglutaminase-like domain-containing protein [Marinibactrum halimedae]GLS26659.1 protein-glutamine gamma-glutamyltransferase [Marinibactrum halimedae]
MSLSEQIPRNCFAWMLLALVAIILPHATHLPVWELVALTVALIWRVQLYRGVWRYPGLWAKVLLAVLSIAGLRLAYGRFLGLEPMVALLIISVILKLLEMNKRRDAFMVIYLGFFVTATQFLFHQNIFAAFYGFFCVLLLMTTLMALSRGPGVDDLRSGIPVAFKLMMQSLPVMLVLFLLFPRLGNLWAVPMPQHTAKTGVSDTMSPGDFSSLSRGGGRAFTATFEGEVPSARDLYWRGMVMDEFDGRTWSSRKWGFYPDGGMVEWNKASKNATSPTANQWRVNAEPIGRSVSYSIIMDPTHRSWLFALHLAESTHEDLGVSRNFTLRSLSPVAQRFQFDVVSYLDHKVESEPLPQWRYKQETALPDGYNPRTRALAQQWREEENSSEAVVDRFLAWVGSEFTYTLEPPLLGRNSVDEFLWQTQRGFCEHFASSFVVFMRAAGIPARVVSGYQGGELVEGFITVSQADAHAWAEVWFEGRGWVRVDPTAAVSPLRIESGINSVFERSVTNPLSMEAYRHISSLNWMRLQMEKLNYNWQRWVLNYDREQQYGMLSRWLGIVEAWKIGVLMLASVAGIVGIIALWMWWHGRPEPLSPGFQAFQRFAVKLKKVGIVREPGEGIRDFSRRAQDLLPDQAPEIQRIERLLQSVLYAEQSECLGPLREEVARFKVRSISAPITSR